MFCMDSIQTQDHLLQQNVTALKIWYEILMETSNLKDMGIDGRIILTE
jgi:hypothetical protein